MPRSSRAGGLFRPWRYLFLLAAVLLLLVAEILLIDRRRSRSPRHSTGKEAAHPGVPGTIHYRDSGLLWTDCAPGQRLIDSHCRGKARLLTWEGAVRFCRELELAGNKEWRLPTREEMELILHCSTSNPTRCLDIDRLPREARQRCHRRNFRRAPVYWTATGPVDCFVQDSPGSGPARCAWAVRFHHQECGRLNAGTALRLISRKGRVRCVGKK